MKLKFVFACLLILFAACQQETIQVIEETFESGKPKKINYYKQVSGQKVISEVKSFYEDGQIELEGFFDEKGQKKGLWKFYYPDGKLWSEAEYLDNKKHGITKVYYQNGKLRYSGTNNMNKPFGKWVFYDEAGLQLEKKVYD